MTDEDETSEPTDYERTVAAEMSRTGKSREEVEALFDLLRSGMRRRGWWDGEPLSEADREATVHRAFPELF